MTGSYDSSFMVGLRSPSLSEAGTVIECGESALGTPNVTVPGMDKGRPKKTLHHRRIHFEPEDLMPPRGAVLTVHSKTGPEPEFGG